MQFLPVFFACLLYYPPLRILNQCCLTTHAATLADQSAQCGEKKTYIKSSENSKKIACFLWLYFGVDTCNGIYSWNGNTALVAIITPVFLLNWSYRDYFWTKCIARSTLCLKKMVSNNIIIHIIIVTEYLLSIFGRNFVDNKHSSQHLSQQCYIKTFRLLPISNILIGIRSLMSFN